jgi:hypothetical protein
VQGKLSAALHLRDTLFKDFPRFNDEAYATALRMAHGHDKVENFIREQTYYRKFLDTRINYAAWQASIQGQRDQRKETQWRLQLAEKTNALVKEFYAVIEPTHMHTWLQDHEKFESRLPLGFDSGICSILVC